MDAMRDEIKDLILGEWHEHRGRLVGTLGGIFVGICILLFGFWTVLFLAVCGAVGWVLGSQHDRDSDWRAILDEALPERFRWSGHGRRRNLR